MTGHDFQGFGDVLAQLGQPGAAAADARHWAGDNDALARQVLGKRAPGWTCAGEARHGGGPQNLGRGGFGGQFILGSRRLQLLELQLHLVQQASRALRARAEAVPVELLDLQLEMHDQRPIAGLLRNRDGGFGACGQQGCLERIDIIRQGGKLGGKCCVHVEVES